MKSLRIYTIPFTGLKLGKHQFEFDVTDSFFDEFDYSLVKKGNLKCVVELEKQETLIILNFHITGYIDLNCDRCLAPYPQLLDIKEQQIAKFSEEEIDEDEEIITLGKSDHEINIAPLIYEYINVSVPFIATCGDEGNTEYCDKEMLDSLEKLAANNNNEQEDEIADPRWEALKKIK
ncbi:YceD family protein [Mucilaginibacter sp.]